MSLTERSRISRCEEWARERELACLTFERFAAHAGFVIRDRPFERPVPGLIRIQAHQRRDGKLLVHDQAVTAETCHDMWRHANEGGIKTMVDMARRRADEAFADYVEEGT